MVYVTKAIALIDLVAAIAPKANSIPLPNSSIAAGVTAQPSNTAKAGAPSVEAAPTNVG